MLLWGVEQERERERAYCGGGGWAGAEQERQRGRAKAPCPDAGLPTPLPWCLSPRCAPRCAMCVHTHSAAWPPKKKKLTSNTHTHTPSAGLAPPTTASLTAVELRRLKKRATNRESARRMRALRKMQWDELMREVRVGGGGGWGVGVFVIIAFLSLTSPLPTHRPTPCAPRTPACVPPWTVALPPPIFITTRAGRRRLRAPLPRATRPRHRRRRPRPRARRPPSPRLPSRRPCPPCRWPWMRTTCGCCRRVVAKTLARPGPSQPPPPTAPPRPRGRRRKWRLVASLGRG